MKKRELFVALVSALSFGATSLNAADAEPAEAKGVSEEERIKVMQTILGFTKEECQKIFAHALQKKIDFTNLRPEQKKLHLSHWAKGRQLLDKGENVSALYYLIEANEICSSNHDVRSRIASIYLEIRSFDEALKVYQKCLEEAPLNVNHRYNLAETHFAMKQYSKAFEQFYVLNELLKVESLKGKLSILEQSSQLKVALCLAILKEDKKRTAEQRADYQKMYDSVLQSFEERAFSHLYYYMNAIRHFEKGDEETGKKWLRDAQYVFSNKKSHVIYIDALIEFGYVDSYYGGKDSEEKQEKPER